MAQSGFTPISIYYSTTASAVPIAANLVQGELAINTNDGKLYYEDSSGVVQTLASKAGALGDVVGPASATDNALARFDLTTGKLIQNSVGILSDAGVLTGLTGLTSSGSITLSSLTSGRVTYAGASGLLTDSANLTYGTGLSVNGISQVYQTGLYTTDGTLSNYSVNNGVYLNGNATGWSQLSGDGTRATFVRVWGSGASPANFIVLHTAGSERMRVDSSGNVGIGTSSPGNLLVVQKNGASNSTLLELGNTDAGGAGSNMIFSGNGNTAARIKSYYTSAWALSLGTDSFLDTLFMVSGNVGIGTTSPNFPLNIYSSAAAIAIQNATTGSANTDGSRIQLSGSDLLLVNRESANLALYTADTERMRIDSTGVVGIGITTAGSNAGVFSQLQIGGTSTADSRTLIYGQKNASAGGIISNGYYDASNNLVYSQTYGVSQLYLNNGTFIFSNAASGTAGTNVTATERMRIDSSGNLCLGQSNATIGGNDWKQAIKFTSLGTGYSCTNSSGNAANFYTSTSTFAGSITVSGAATTYNTSSDYRLKNITGNLTGFKNRIMALQPKQGIWKVDGSEFKGFLAHEFAQQYPNAVNGKKDDVDKNGKPVYQGMQAGGSETIADLVALVQEQQALIDSLTTRLTALENK
jgi:hypothetical protein